MCAAVNGFKGRTHEHMDSGKVKERASKEGMLPIVLMKGVLEVLSEALL